MLWIWKIGFMISLDKLQGSFARGGETIYGPYDLWFERKIWCIYWAVTPPVQFIGFLNV